MAIATAEPHAIIVEPRTMDGYRFLLVRMEADDNGYYNYSQVKAIGKALRYNGSLFTRTGWNSDRGEIYFREGGFVAYPYRG